MDTKTITFNNMPEALAKLIAKVENIETILSQRKEEPAAEEDKQWMSLKELRAYHPDHPADSTVYGWVRNHQIPYFKAGKKLAFKKSDVDAWIESGRAKTFTEIQDDAIQYINGKRLRR